MNHFDITLDDGNSYFGKSKDEDDKEVSHARGPDGQREA